MARPRKNVTAIKLRVLVAVSRQGAIRSGDADKEVVRTELIDPNGGIGQVVQVDGVSAEQGFSPRQPGLTGGIVVIHRDRGGVENVVVMHSGKEGGSCRTHVGGRDGGGNEGVGVHRAGFAGNHRDHLGIAWVTILVGIAPQHNFSRLVRQRVGVHDVNGGDDLSARLNHESVEPHKINGGDDTKVRLGVAVVVCIRDGVNGEPKLTLVGDQVAITVGARPGQHIIGIKDAVVVAVLTEVWDAIGIGVIGIPGGKVARVQNAVVVAIFCLFGTRIGEAILVTVVPDELAFIWDRVSIAIGTGLIVDVDAVEYAVGVAIFAFVRCSVAVLID